MEVVINIPATRQATYVVSGATFALLRAQLESHGEWGTFTGRLVSTTRGNPVTRVIVACRPSITMPEWRERSAAARPLQAEWDRMIGALGQHEAGHDDILRRIANEFRDTVTGLSPPPDRRTLTTMRRQLLSDHNDRQQSYDRTTQHGQRTGVALTDP